MEINYEKEHRNWTRYLKYRKLYGIFIYDVGRVIVRQNNYGRNLQYSALFTSYDLQTISDGDGCFTKIKWNIVSKDDLKFQILYNLNVGNTTINWIKIFDEYIVYCDKLNSLNRCNKIARKKRKEKKIERDKYLNEKENSEDIKWRNRFYQKSCLNKFNNYRR